MHRPLLATALLVLCGAPAVFAEAGQPAPAPRPQPMSIPITPGKSIMTIRLVNLDAAGAMTPDSQKAVDDLCADGWRAGSLTSVSAPGASPVVLAVMFTHPAPPAGGPGAPPHLGPAVPPSPQAAPAPAPGPAANPAPAQERKPGL